MKRIAIFGILISTLLPLRTLAQVEKQVEVSKHYTTRLSTSEKLALTPDFTDTVKLRPEIDYRLTPRAVNTPLSRTLFEPAELTYWEFNRPSPLYLKAGVGYPLQSVGDLALTTHHPDIGFATLYANHEGYYSKIRALSGDKNKATRLYNRLGGVAGHRFERNIIEGELGYENRIDHRYGAIDPTDLRMVGSRINYGRMLARLRLGNDFEDSHKVNYNIEGYTTLLHDNSETPGPMAGRQLDAGGSAQVGFRRGEHLVGLQARFEGMWGRESWDPNRNLNLEGAMHYDFANRIMHARVGARYLYTKIRQADAEHRFNYILPDVELRFNVGRGAFVPYLQVDGQVEQNDWGHLVEENIYAQTGVWLPKNTVEYRLRVGFDGNIRSRFSYRLYAQYSIIENFKTWYAINDHNHEAASNNFLIFAAEQSRCYQTQIGGELRWRPGRNFLVEFGADYYHYNSQAELYVMEELPTGLPELESHLALSYNHERFTVGVSAELTSSRQWGCIRYGQVVNETALPLEATYFDAPWSVDVGLHFDYHLKHNLTLFLEGQNLANQRLYRWAYYPSHGIGFVAGVKLTF